VDLLKDKGVNMLYHETEGSHVWSVWRSYLNETAPMLFRDNPKKRDTSQNSEGRKQYGKKRLL
jgi:hypothetical protein